MTPLRLALIGCGKVTERFHLPVALASPEVRVSALIDPDEVRARQLGAGVEGALVFASPAGIAEHADAAVVAAPHHLHADISCSLLDQGVSVLVEKPMALDVASCDRMIAAAERSDVVLAVGLVRRWYDASRWVKASLDAGDLGPVVSVDAREGAVFNWQVVSDATFRRAMGGGGLADIGTHVLDLLLWWLGDPQRVAYRDDAMGGVEAECEIELEFPGGVTGTVALSRTRTLRNSIVVRCERGTLTIGPGFDPEIRLEHDDRAPFLSAHVHAPQAPPAVRLETLFEAQLRDFVGAVRDRRPPFVSGADGRRSIALLDACRRAREPLELPWLRPASSGRREEAST